MRWLMRLGWFAAIWIGSVALLGLIAYVIRSVLVP